MSLLWEMFTYPFILRAFVVGILVALCAALLGVPLVLKRYSMIGDGLSHVSFGALSIALACGWAPLPVSIPVVILAALGLLRMTEKSRMGADAAIAVVSASALAIGVVVTSLTTGMTTDVDSFMFGSILAMDRADVALSVVLCAAVLVLYILFYHRLFAITFDESFSRATGVRVGLYNTILSVLTALTIVLGMRMMGAMLISSLVIFPALTAMGLLRSFRGVVLCAAGLSVVCFCIGLTGSYLWGTPVGATVVLVNLAAFLLSRVQNGGRLCAVFPAPRFLALCDAMRGAKVEPKRVRFIVSRPESAPKLVLVEGKKRGRPGLHLLPMLVTHTADGGFTEEMRRIYGEL